VDNGNLNDLFVGEASQTLVEKAKNVARLHAEKKAAKQAHDEKIAEFKAAEEELLTIMDNDGVTSLSVGENQVYRREITYVSVNKAREDEAFAWLAENGYGDVIKRAANSQSLTSLYKEMVHQELDVPEELFNISPVVNVGVLTKKR
jgi:hypothetical protein